MNAINAAIKEIVGLFVDDSGLALLAILAIAIMTALTKLSLLPPLWAAVGIFLGCAAALAASLLRAGRVGRR